MTAEIAIMNKRAIALATDSAVTIGDGDKFYNTADKLFMLSKFHPIGIMIFNNAEFMGVPWELIIKQYRDYVGTEEFDSLGEYCNSFLDYLKHEDFNLSKCESDYVNSLVKWFINDLNRQIQKNHDKMIEVLARKLNPDELKDMVEQSIMHYQSLVNSFNDIKDLPGNFDEYIEEKYKEEILRLIDNIIGASFIKPECLGILLKSCITIFRKQIRDNSYSGIVIAGFGKKDIFPSLVEYEISGMVNGVIRFVLKQQRGIDTKKDYDIVPFAQTDIVDTFLKGISPSYLNVINDSFKTQIISSIEDIDNGILDTINKSKVKEEITKKWNDVIEAVNDYSNNKYLFPILRAIRVLPKDELASMAESLVNLTSFKRQVAVDEYSQTVGGPIDVAIISKGDGFVWIKRKHYFKSELNHHFFENYYNKCKEVKSDE